MDEQSQEAGLTDWIEARQAARKFRRMVDFAAGFKAAVELLREETRFEEYFQEMAHAITSSTVEMSPPLTVEEAVEMAKSLPSFGQAQQLAGYLEDMMGDVHQDM